MIDLSLILANNFRQIRIACGGTQNVFAEMVGLTQAQISRLESGQSFSRMGKLGEQLAEAGANPLDLLHQAGPVDLRSAEIRRLMAAADEQTLEIVLLILRKNAASQKRMTGA